MTVNHIQGAVDLIAANSGGVLEYIYQKYIVSGRKSRNNQTYQTGSVLSNEEVLRLAQRPANL
jgi:hypothetical protein